MGQVSHCVAVVCLVLVVSEVVGLWQVSLVADQAPTVAWGD